DGARLDRLLHSVARHHVFEGVVERPQVGVHLLLQVARQESETLPRLHRGAREDDAPHPLARQRVDRRRHGTVGLSRPRRPTPAEPCSVSVSPRSETRTPSRFASSTRLPSFTPASERGSTPSVESRWMTSSLMAPL